MNNDNNNNPLDYDYVIVGSGFGGSVSALRLAEKGYKVAVIEQGKWYHGDDFAKSNWDLKRWLWMPKLRLTGIMQLSFLKHVNALSGVGVGGGSLVYASTLPIPKTPFFESGSWAKLNDWETALAPHYKTAYKMLGTNENPSLHAADLALQKVAARNNKQHEFHHTKVAVYFGQPGETVKDPYFDGKGPDRTGCIHCGACMTGCRHNAKNTLDKNYLHLAQQLGAEIKAETKVIDVKPLPEKSAANDRLGSQGYVISVKSSTKLFSKTSTITAKGVIFSAGVMGTVPLLQKLKATGSLPRLSNQLGKQIRTNNESLISVTSLDKEADYSKGLAIGSILHPDDDSHLEVCRYSAGSGFWRLLMVPRVSIPGKSMVKRLGILIGYYLKNPKKGFKLHTVDDWAKRTTVLLFMQHLDSTLQFKRGLFGGIKTEVTAGDEAPTAHLPVANKLAKQYEEEVNGVATSLLHESLKGVPGTAHILGGAVMGKDDSQGVIDRDNRVFGYCNMLVCDGSMISANPGVNPSLTITAISEHAMSQIPLASH